MTVKLFNTFTACDVICWQALLTFFKRLINMKAIKFKQFGPSSVLEVMSVPTPVLSNASQGQMLIRVYSAGINPIDAKIREGSSFVCQNLNLPSGLGFELCGEVVELGEGASDFKVGDVILGKVVNYNQPCTYSEYCIIDESSVILKPKSMSAEVAGALPTAGFTAWQAVHTHGKVKSGDRVLIHAGAGGVGHLAIQIAKLAGAFVITTASEKHHEFLKDLGVDEIIDYRKESFVDRVNNVDVVIDLVGSETGLQSLSVLKPTGRLVTVPTITRDEILAEAGKQGVNATGMLAENNKSDLEKLAGLIAEDKIQLKISASFPLSQAKEAHDLLETKRTQGKIVLMMQ